MPPFIPEPITINSQGDNNKLVGQAVAHRDVVINKFEGIKAPKKVTFNVPKVKNFTGRERELEQLKALLIDQPPDLKHNVVCIFGTPGVGKSALAFRFAQLYKELDENPFEDGILYCRVDSEGEDMRAIARKFVNMCGDTINPKDQQDASDLMKMFSGRRCLLILDNAESSAVEELFPGGAECAVIVTTRKRELPSLLLSEDIPVRQVNLEPLPSEDAIAMLQTLVTRQWTKADLEAGRQISEFVGKLPLALRVVGAALNMGEWGRRPLAEYLERLREKRLQFLSVLGEKDLNVRTSFKLSIESLKKDSREETIQFFACLGVCAASSFSLETAAKTGNVTKSDAVDHLNILGQLCLVNRIEEESDRYNLHTLLREFALDQLDANALDVAQKRHAEFVTALVERGVAEDSSILVILDREIEEVISTAQWLQGQEIPDYHFVLKLDDFFEQYGHWKQAEEIFTGFQKLAVERQEWSIGVELAASQVEFMLLQGQNQPAQDLVDQLMELVEQIESSTDKTLSKAICLKALGSIHQRQKRLPEAEKALRQSHELLVTLGDNERQRRAYVLNKLGTVLQRRKQLSEATTVLRQSESLFVETNDLRGLRKVLTSLGIVLHRQEDFEAALASFQRSRSLSEQLGDLRGKSIVLNQMGKTLQALKRFDEAKIELLESYNSAKKLNDLGGQALALRSLLQLPEVQRDCSEMTQLAENQEGRSLLLGVSHKAAVELAQQRRFEEAQELAKQSVQLAKQTKDRKQLAALSSSLNFLARIYKKEDNLDEAAITLLREAVKLDQQCRDRTQIFINLTDLSKVYKKQGNLHETVTALRHAGEIDQQCNDFSFLSISLNILAGIYKDQGNVDEAINALKEAVEASRKCNDLAQLTVSLTALGELYIGQGNSADAKIALQNAVQTACEQPNNLEQITICLKALEKAYLGKADRKKLGSSDTVIALETALQLAKRHYSPTQLGTILKMFSKFCKDNGHLSQAITMLEEAVQLASENDGFPRVSYFRILGTYYAEQGEFTQAIRALQNAVQLSCDNHDSIETVNSLRALGDLHNAQGNRQQAINSLQQAAEVARENKCFNQMFLCLKTLVSFCKTDDEASQLSLILHEAAHSAPDDQDLLQLAICFKDLGEFYKTHNRLPQAIAALQEAVKLARDRSSNPIELVNILMTLGELYRERGDLPETAIALQEAIQVNRKTRRTNFDLLAKSLGALGSIYKAQGKLPEAAEALEEAVKIARRRNNPIRRMVSLRALGIIYKEQNKLPDAAAALKQVVQIADTQNELHEKAVSLNIWGQVLQGQEQIDLAIAKFDESIQLGKQLNDLNHLAQVYTVKGKALISQNRYEEAIEALKEAFEINAQRNNLLGLKYILSSLCWGLRQLDRLSDAVEYCDRAIRLFPQEKSFRDQRRRLSDTPILNLKKQSSQHTRVQGTIKNILIHEKGNFHGYIQPDDGGEEILFHEQQIAPALFSKLRCKQRVEVLVQFQEGQVHAESIRIFPTIQPPVKKRNSVKNKAANEAGDS